MRNKRKSKAVRLICAFLALLCLLFSVSCGDSKEKTVHIEDVTVIAIVGEDFTEAFATASANVLRAGNESDFLVSRLTSEQIMARTPDGSYAARNGSITVKNEDGKTVATVKINKNMEYYSGQRVYISDYISLMEQICQYTYNGYYQDFYKNPIEGLVAYRFKKRGLKLSDLPDFDAQTKEKLEALNASSYEEWLRKTSIAGLFDGNASALNYDGKTFRQTIENATPDLPAGFFSGASKDELLRRLCAILAARPQTEWIREELYPFVYDDTVDAYRRSMEALRDNPGEITGLHKVDDYTCTVTFEREIDEKEAIAMLNLPLIYSNGSRRLGAFNFKKSAEGTTGRALSYVNKKGLNLMAITTDAGIAIDSIAVGQIRIAVFTQKPDDAITQRARGAGLTLEAVGGGWAVYDAKTADAEFVRSLAVFD